MFRRVKTEVFYPHPPQKVWQVITDRQALAAWLMENDFEPRVGHKFRFQAHDLPGLEEIIYCEVLELEQPKRLVFTWQDSFMHQPSIVTWTLTPVDGGTQLLLEHRCLSHAVVEMPAKLVPEQPHTYTWQAQFMYETSAIALTLESFTHPTPNFRTHKDIGLSKVLHPQSHYVEGWEYRLHQKLPQILAQVALENK